MNLGRSLVTAFLMTLVTTLLLGVAYPLVVTALAQVMFPDSANGQLLIHRGRVLGSRIIGQEFTQPEYFHGRPSAAGAGYDAARPGGTNLGPTNRTLIEAVTARVVDARLGNSAAMVPIDLVTSSASGLDPDISPAAALFQVSRVARARHVGEAEVRRLVESHIEDRQLGFLGERRVNVLLLNLALDERYPRADR
jgi:potassium-transporting ATPase KdpC subunit